MDLKKKKEKLLKRKFKGQNLSLVAVPAYEDSLLLQFCTLVDLKNLIYQRKKKLQTSKSKFKNFSKLSIFF